MVAKSEKRHETKVAFVQELGRIAHNFNWEVTADGAILGTYIERMRKFTPMCAVAFIGTGVIEFNEKFAADVCGLKEIAGEVWVASMERNNTELRRWILDAVGLVKER